MTAILRDDKGLVEEVQIGGSTVWKREDTVRRDRISDESINSFLNADTAEEKVDAVFHWITGKTVGEASK